MPTSDTVQLLIDIVGRQGLDELVRTTEEYRQKIADLNGRMASGQIAGEEYARELAGLVRVLEQVQRLTEKLSRGLDESAHGYQVLTGAMGTYAVGVRASTHELDEQVRAAHEATLAQKAMAVVLEDVGPAAGRAADGVDKLKGKRGLGLMGASYALQDFITVVSMGGGWGRAMSSMANNITPTLMALGAGAGLAGVLGTVVTVASAGTMALEGWWKAADSDRADAAKDKLKAIEDQVKRTNAEFAKLLKSPTDAEREAAEGFSLFFKDRDKAAMAGQAVGAKLSGKEIFESLTPEQRAEFVSIEKDATRTDKSLRGTAAGRAARLLGAEATPDAIERMAADILKDLQEARATAQRRRREILAEGRKQGAGAIITGSMAAGPEGEAARRRLLELTKGNPALKELQLYDPQRIADEIALDAQQEAEGAVGSEEWVERQRAGVRARKKARREQERKNAERGRRQKEQTDAILRGHTERIKEEERQKKLEEQEEAREQADADRENREWARGRGKRAQVQRERQAGELVGHLPEIAGAAYGLGAAAMASRANPAELRAIAEQTARNLEAGQLPHAAILDAFREVADAAARNARQSMQFYQNLNGMREQLQSRTQPFGDSISY